MSNWIILLETAVMMLFVMFIVHIVNDRHFTRFQRYFVDECIRQAGQKFGTDFQLPRPLKVTLCSPYDILMDDNSTLYYNACSPREMKKLNSIYAQYKISALLLVKQCDTQLEKIECYSRNPSTDYHYLRSYDPGEIEELCQQHGLDPTRALDRPEVLDLIMHDCMSDAFAAPFMESGEPLSRLLKERDM